MGCPRLPLEEEAASVCAVYEKGRSMRKAVLSVIAVCGLTLVGGLRVDRHMRPG